MTTTALVALAGAATAKITVTGTARLGLQATEGTAAVVAGANGKMTAELKAAAGTVGATLTTANDAVTSAADLTALDNAITASQASAAADATAAVKKTQDLVQASMKLGEAIYKSQQSAKPEDKNNSNKEEKKDDDVVDADFEEVKDENKEKSA